MRIPYALAAVLSTAVAANLTPRGTPTEASATSCHEAYGQCINDGRQEVACQCDLATCTGEDNQRTREFCAGVADHSPSPPPGAPTPLDPSPAPPPPLPLVIRDADAADSNPCLETYDKCLKDKEKPEIACGCDFQVCAGQDTAATRAFCAKTSAPCLEAYNDCTKNKKKPDEVCGCDFLVCSGQADAAKKAYCAQFSDLGSPLATPAPVVKRQAGSSAPCLEAYNTCKSDGGRSELYCGCAFKMCTGNFDQETRDRCNKVGGLPSPSPVVPRPLDKRQAGSSAPCLEAYNTCKSDGGRSELYCGCAFKMCTGNFDQETRDRCNKVGGLPSPSPRPLAERQIEERSGSCLDAYQQCVANKKPLITCQCNMAVCTGEDNAQTRERCAKNIP